MTSRYVFPVLLTVFGSLLAISMMSIFTYAFLGQSAPMLVQAAQTRGPEQITIPQPTAEAAVHIGWNDLAAVAALLTATLSAVHIIVTRVVIQPMLDRTMKSLVSAAAMEAHEELDRTRHDNIEQQNRSIERQLSDIADRLNSL